MVPERPRVSAAVLRDEGREVLMVKHRRPDGTEYWQLPGGGLLPDESPEAGVLRELHEEANLAGRVVRFLFTIPYKYGTSTTFLVEIDPTAQASPSRMADLPEPFSPTRKVTGASKSRETARREATAGTEKG